MTDGAADRHRAGAQVLALLASPLNERILRAHAEGSLQLDELQRRTALPPRTTLRVAIDGLRRLGALRRAGDEAPAQAATELTPAGSRLLVAAAAVERWLRHAPEGGIAAGSDAAKATVKAFADGWSSTMISVLAAEPASLTELDRRIPQLSYPAIERRLAKLKMTRQVEPAPNGESQRTPYAVADWLRHGTASLCVAAHCERYHLPAETTPIEAADIEAILLLVLPLAKLPPTVGGAATLAVQAEPGGTGGNDNGRVAGVRVEGRAGGALSYGSELPLNPATWALGRPETWLDALVEGDAALLRIGGRAPRFATALVEALHLALFPPS